MKLVSKYLIVGIWNTAFGISVFFAVSNLLPFWPNFSVLFLSYLISIVQSHFSQRYCVWGTRTPYIRELKRFATGYFAQFLINLALLEIAVNAFPLHRNYCQMFITLTFVVVSFFINKKFVFLKS
jgi:putative flippase GtrA